jgi:SAM-dependent methyltransferase
MKTETAPIDQMPRGGPDASWLDRRLQTEALEYTDRYDVPDEVKQAVIRALDRGGRWFGHNDKLARLALELVDDITAPRILELGAGHGQLSAKLVERHPAATVTVSDLYPTSVNNIAAGPLGQHPRVTTKVVDASRIDLPDNSFDLVILAVAFHHLPPAVARDAIAEATRVGRRFLIVDPLRPRPAMMLFMLGIQCVFLCPLWLIPSLRPAMHDGVISLLRSYSRSAVRALARAADPALTVYFLDVGIPFPKLTAAVLSRPDEAVGGH